MRRLAVVAVHAVLLQQFPVCGDRVLLASLDDLHAMFALISDVCQIVRRARQIVDQRLHIAIETDEDESAELFHSLNANQIKFTVVRRVGGECLAARHSDEMPLLVEGPGMIAARECAPIARALSTDHCPPMGAGIVQGVQIVLAVPCEQQGATANAAGNEAAGLGNLRHMSEIKPALLEDSIPL